MESFLWFVMILNAVVDLLLLSCAGVLSGYPPDSRRLLPGGLLGGIYAGAAATAQLNFLGNWYWRLIFMCLICLTGFGMERSSLRKSALYVLLRLALDGIGAGMHRGGIWSLGAGALGLCFLCTIGFRSGVSKRYVPVELQYKGRSIRLTALRDTGNSLYDPLTGRSVLVVGPDLATELTGLTREDLRSPAKSIFLLPGGRLIPFKTISDPAGLLLALPIPEVRIGSWKGKCLVAFAPERVGNGEFEALTGG